MQVLLVLAVPFSLASRSKSRQSFWALRGAVDDFFFEHCDEHSNKVCFGTPSDCLSQPGSTYQNCSLAASLQSTGDEFTIEMYAKTTPHDYVAVAFQPKGCRAAGDGDISCMSEAPVFECSNFGDDVTARLSYNVASMNTRLENAEELASSMSLSLQSYADDADSLTCRVTFRPSRSDIDTANDDKVLVLRPESKNAYLLLLAAGETSDDAERVNPRVCRNKSRTEMEVRDSL